MNCYRCGVPLTDENRSEEHVINNALGGHLTSNDLLCGPCNNYFGHTVDVELEQQIGMFTDLLGIKRHREDKGRKVRIEMVSQHGERKVVGRKLKPLHELRLDTGVKKVVLFEDEARYETLKNRKKMEMSSNSNVEDKEYIREPDKTKYHVQNSLSDEEGNIAFGGPEFFRGAAKIALGYYLSQGYDSAYDVTVKAFVNGERTINDFAYYYYPKHYQIHDLNEDEIIHLIHIRGDVQYKLLYAYVELFSCHNAIIIFSLNYEGPAIVDTYAYDLLAGQQIEKKVKMWLPRHHIEVINLIERNAQPEHLRLFNRLERITEKRQLI